MYTECAVLVVCVWVWVCSYWQTRPWVFRCGHTLCLGATLYSNPEGSRCQHFSNYSWCLSQLTENMHVMYRPFVTSTENTVVKNIHDTQSWVNMTFSCSILLSVPEGNFSLSNGAVAQILMTVQYQYQSPVWIFQTVPCLRTNSCVSVRSNTSTCII